MSADNWAVCPKCQHEREQELAAMEAEVTAAYGKVPVDEFDALRDAYAEKERLYVNPEDHNEFRTFREDYEFYGADEGVVHVRYGGQCTKCGTGTTINQDHEFWRKP